MKQDPGANVQVFVVWEPVLATDWGTPGSGLTSNVADGRAVHYWDPSRRLSAVYGGVGNLPAIAAESQIAFKMKDVIWDSAIVYPPGAKWGSRADVLVAPVFKFPKNIAARLNKGRS